MSDSTTEIYRRKVRHWKTTAAGVATLLGPVAAAIWPAHAATINNVVIGLIGAGLMSAADAPKKEP